MTIRPIRRADVEQVTALSGGLGYPASASQIEARLNSLEALEDHAVFVAVEDGGAIRGWAHVQGRLLLESDPFAEIVGLVVDSRHRGRGVGRKLVERAERWAVERGFREFRVRSNVVRDGARRFYERLGYSVVKSQAVFSKRIPGGGTER